MVVVLIALTIGSLLSIAALSAATGDFPAARKSQDRKAAYAAAESGLAYFNFRLNQNNVYWKTCGDSNSGRVPQTGSKLVPGTSQGYVIEFLPANGAPKCDQSTPDATMIDRTTATFRIRVTGRSGNVYRSIVAAYHRKTFLDYLWYTTSEAGDPAIFSGTPTECLKPRASRSGCTEISFIAADEIKGPMHTDDTYQVCANPLFGRDPTLYSFPVNDPIESSGPAPGYTQTCSGAPRVYGTQSSGVTPMTMPSTNAGLATVAAANGYTFTGRIRVQLNGSRMDVWQQDANGNDTTKLVTAGWPPNGVLFDKSGTCTSNPSPITTTYNESAGCANVYVSGTYSADLTIAAANDIVVAPTSRTLDERQHRAHGRRQPRPHRGSLRARLAPRHRWGFVRRRLLHEQHARRDHREDRRRDHVRAALVHRGRLRQGRRPRRPDGQRRHRPEVPRRGRDQRQRLQRPRLQQGLQLRRPVPLPEPAVVPGSP